MKTSNGVPTTHSSDQLIKPERDSAPVNPKAVKGSHQTFVNHHVHHPHTLSKFHSRKATSKPSKMSAKKRPKSAPPSKPVDETPDSTSDRPKSNPKSNKLKLL